MGNLHTAYVEAGHRTRRQVPSIGHGQGEQGIKDALAEATKEGLKASIAGKRHSMGGHAFYKDAVVLDMTSFDKILNVDAAAKTITVQSGATWRVLGEADQLGVRR